MYARAALASALLLASPAAALQVSLAVRETGSLAAIGQDGGQANGIEWLDLDGQELVLDGTWQLFSFDLDTAPVTAFAGATADGVLDGLSGVLEHIRFRNDDGLTQQIHVWIDDVADTVVPVGAGGTPVTTTFGSFEGLAEGLEYMFNEPGFSGSTAANLVDPGFAGVDTAVAHSGAASYRAEFQFIDADTTRWMRLTSFSTGSLPGGNPTIRFDSQSVVTFWLRGLEVPEPGAASLLLAGAAAFAARRRLGPV